MEKISLTTLLLALKMKNDYDLHAYAKTTLEERYGFRAAAALEDIMKTKGLTPGRIREKLHASSDNAVIDMEEMYAAIAKVYAEEEFSINAIMEMYRSGDPFLEKKSKEYIVIKYGNYIHSMINKMYSMFDAEMKEEMYQYGVIGLLKAMEHYDENISVFNTFSTNFIRHELIKQINFLNNDTTMHYAQKQKAIVEAEKKLKESGIIPTIEKISEITNISPKYVRKEIEYRECINFYYLDAENVDEPLDSYENTPEYIAASREKSELLCQSLKSLSEKKRRIIELKFIEEKTTDYIAKEMGMSISQVKTSIKNGLDFLRHDPVLCSFYPEYQPKTDGYDSSLFTVSAVRPKSNDADEFSNLLDIMNELKEVS